MNRLRARWRVKAQLQNSGRLIRLHQGRAGENLSRLGRMANNQLKRETRTDQRPPRQRPWTDWDHPDLLRVLGMNIEMRWPLRDGRDKCMCPVSMGRLPSRCAQVAGHDPRSVQTLLPPDEASGHGRVRGFKRSNRCVVGAALKWAGDRTENGWYVARGFVAGVAERPVLLGTLLGTRGGTGGVRGEAGMLNPLCVSCMLEQNAPDGMAWQK